MANLKEVRTRIASVASMEQITNAMKMVSASKLRKAQTALQKSQPYAEKIEELLLRFYATEETKTIYTQERPIENVLLVAVASNRGLCGAFNFNIVKAVKKRINEYWQHDNFAIVHVITVGKKVSDAFRTENYQHWTPMDELLDNIDPKATAEFADSLIANFLKGKYDRIEFIYNRFKNAATQIITSENFLPIGTHLIEQNNKVEQIDYILEPNREEIVAKLTTLALQTQVYQLLLSSNAAENGARMVTMQKASDNAGELLKELKLSYNKARQSAITNELIEIMSGANIAT